MGRVARKEIVRIGKVAQKALWRYLMHRPDNGLAEIWLSEKKPLSCGGVQCLVRRLKKRAGINSDGSVHRFRHTFASIKTAMRRLLIQVKSGKK